MKPPPATNTTTTGGNGIKRLQSPPPKRDEVKPWILCMIKIMQYEDCKIHSNAKDNKLDRFCIDCVGSFCKKCSSNHHGHNYIQIRRYVYRDVINRQDFQKHFDCSRIQNYFTNKTKVLFLKPKQVKEQQQQQQQQQNTYRCTICNQSIPDSSYCSIQCKISDVYKNASTEEARVDNNGSIDKDEGLENGLHDAKEEELKLMPFKRRKGFPYRSPFF